MSKESKPITRPASPPPSTPVKRNDGGGAPGPRHPNPIPCPPKPKK